jgi:Xaa-Pro aminopeptidase
MRTIIDALPKAQIYGENEVLNQARLIRGPEEIAVIQKCTAANEAAIRVMFESARPGVRQQDVWFAMNDVLTREAGSWPARLSVTFDGSGNESLGMPYPDRIRDGALCSQEICSRVQGYRAQCNHTFKVGTSGPADYPDAMRATMDVYSEMVAWMAPGKSIDELLDRYAALCAQHGAQDRSGVVYHSNGLGNDFPRLGPRLARGTDGRLPLQPGMTFTLKPVLRFPSGTTTQFGDPVEITTTGARRLGTRPLEPVIVG